MSAAKRRKRSKTPIRFEMSRLAVVGWCFGLLLALLWMFALGLFVGKGITPANINFAEIKKRIIAEGVWPGSGKAQQSEETSQAKKTKKQIPLKDLEFYEKLAKKKKAKIQEQTKVSTPTQKRPSTTVSKPAKKPATEDSTSQRQQTSSTGHFTVQLASFKDLESAKKFAFAARFKDLKPRATVRQVDLAGKGRWYRVQVGELSSRDEATALAIRLTQKYRLRAFVVVLDGAGGK